ncbi:hypothetical protein K438DRAFT_1936340 [Mycena galopus ATCC 62051]|nr:hypothetical protein K438DRAFT_1936340 [Mycena galopus ATCC 62051]
MLRPKGLRSVHPFFSDEARRRGSIGWKTVISQGDGRRFGTLVGELAGVQKRSEPLANRAGGIWRHAEVREKPFLVQRLLGEREDRRGGTLRSEGSGSTSTKAHSRLDKNRVSRKDRTERRCSGSPTCRLKPLASLQTSPYILLRAREAGSRLVMNR